MYMHRTVPLPYTLTYTNNLNSLNKTNVKQKLVTVVKCSVVVGRRAVV